MRHSDETQQEGYFKNAKANQMYSMKMPLVG